MDAKDLQKRFENAYKLLAQETTNREKFESVRVLIKGFNPAIDTALEKVSKALSDVEKVLKADYIQLGAENLPESTDEEKKRKKALLIFINNWKELVSEVDRVKKELSEKENDQGQNTNGKIIKFAKGPFGIITLAAIAIVIFLGLVNFQQSPARNGDMVKELPSKQKIQVIIVDGKKIPLSEVHSGVGPECEGKSHYHANVNQAVKAIDGTIVSDPGGCGYGKVEEIKIDTI